MYEDWKHNDITGRLELMCHVAENVFGLDRVGIVNGEVWYNDWETGFGMSKWKLYVEEVQKLLMKVDSVKVDRRLVEFDAVYHIEFKTDEGFHGKIQDTDICIGLMRSALKIIGWKGEYYME